MRRREHLTPEEARELEAIDLALAGEPVDDDLRELDDLVHEVRATAPEMSPALAARLERLVEHGPESATEPVQPRRSRRWVLVPAAGTVAAAVVALVIVLSNGNGDSSDAVIHGMSGGKDAPARATPGSAAADESAPTSGRRAQRSQSAPAPAASSRSGPAFTPQSARKVERSVFLVLATPKDKVESTADDVVQTVDRFRGIVARSSVAADDRSGGEATFDLRIPTSRVEEALGALSKLGHVAERRQDLRDITASFSSTQERLDEARAERRALLRALGNATTQARIESIRTRLRLVRAQIASAKGQMASLQRRANYSRVSVIVRGNSKAEQVGGTWSPGDAAGDALRVLEVIAGIALIALAVAIPLALLGAAILFGARVTRTRRRESALDPT
ncbi:hypothetical protein BH20ACT17_BH20ACT17_07950 [soil metagenome]